MECAEDTKRLSVETDKAIYQIQFGQIQIEITGRCNMLCEHCRAANDLRRDMPVDQIIKIIRFARQFSPNYKEIVISGGEPLLHAQFPEVLEAVRKNGGESITLTTNGSLLDEAHLRLIESLKFKRFMLSVSLDSLDPQDHDRFRGRQGAFQKAARAIQMIVRHQIPNVITSVRMTIRPHQILLMEEMVRFAYVAGCNRVSLSSIHPAGRAADQPDLWMDKEQKKQFLEKVYVLKGEYPSEFQVSTNDPLKCILRRFSDVGEGEELVFDGCPAAAVTFNVNASGNMTPCALMNLPIMNVFALSIEEINQRYQNSEIVRNMLDMNLGGKCGACSKKYQCGGCRARAMVRNGHYLAEDPDCWL